jgi:hypothetical protein
MDPIVSAALIAGAASVLVALVGLFGIIIPRLHRNTHSLRAVKAQVLNSHGSNLRDDLDFIRDVVLDVRDDLACARLEHLILVQRVDTLEEEK